MINGAHVLLYTTNAGADRAFLGDVLGMRSVDAGHGWLIFALPPAEVAIHPAEADALERAGRQLATELYLMCDDVRATVASLEAKSVRCAEIETAPWGIRTSIRLPSGAELGLYEPTHPTAIGLANAPSSPRRRRTTAPRAAAPAKPAKSVKRANAASGLKTAKSATATKATKRARTARKRRPRR